ncbi:hypothetical protein ACQRIT_007826 [Beauveria bassiana]|uniref:Uncharacterized protein n=2 Tax=Beauveria bassiana TaxID=176275 RepID=J4UJW5_BEAB2|nr:uncharacterized protein BBA_06649 [Beauveria bassiana ARSEF 2860]EJP64267.1 hypothetical protein BBA_06649 [Beauveria bassiana ARSEF 2860]KAH8711316.1 hypothetical protein HC256_008131 [Beauveria bassiana]PQK15456.1 hypothetical protein BB8028_0005g09690 [Beauveria bassiana]
MDECCCDRDDLDKISKGWSIAMFYSKERLRRVYELDDAQLDKAVEDGKLVLETLCLFVHACIKRGQYRLPAEFWRVLHVEYGIVVYPSALTEDIDVQGLGVDVTFTDAYSKHIIMFGRCGSECHPPPCPLQYLQEPPPVYQK